MQKKVPYIEKRKKQSVMIVDEKPFIALSGEVRNSSASDLQYMEEIVWPNIKELHLNTLIVPVYWETVEPLEGQFDFTLVEGLIHQAREHKLKLIILWFGSWKNGCSTYAPEWIKEDRGTYPFVKKKSGQQIYSITPLCKEAIHKDANAFSMLMKRIREVDENEQTVIMVQVQNEVGSLETDFDYSEEALKLYKQKVPSIVESYVGKSGTWEELFGEDSKEFFMAYHYATAIEEIAAAGKREYNLPFFVNAWLEQFPYRAGIHPSGGPVSKVISFYLHLAPTIMACAPDIYVPNFIEVCDEFAKEQDILLIPEARQDVVTVSNFLYSVGAYSLGCFSPFGIEDIAFRDKEVDKELLKSLSIEATAFDSTGTYPYICKAYEIIGTLYQLICSMKEKNQVFPFIREYVGETGKIIELNDCDMKINYKSVDTNYVPIPAGMIIQVSENEAFVVGTNINVEIISKKDSEKQYGLLALEEGSFVEGIWQRKRILNGDERQINVDDMPNVLRVKWHQY